MLDDEPTGQHTATRCG